MSAQDQRLATGADAQADARPDLILDSLGYVGVSSDRLDDWKRFGHDIAGMQPVETTRRGLTLRMDDRSQRFVISDDGGRGFYGFEVSGPEALERVARRLDERQVPHHEMDRVTRDHRRVSAGLWCLDPEGNRIEVFHGPEVADQPFSPGRTMSGFRTGVLGLGHAVLLAADAPRMVTFYQEVLGFRLSDYQHQPFEAYFFHLNPRHHTLAIVAAHAPGVHHVMVELGALDDVGAGFDLAESSPEGIAVSLGRHSNDHMTSFYAHTPSPFMLELGWGGRWIDVDRWQPYELTEGPSLWGHERSWLTPEVRETARRMRIRASAEGRSYPVHVRDGAYDVIPEGTWTPSTLRGLVH
ncbi:VOC family protein [Raineyella sp.]|uniref:VOC family protein n=1 Tax=Raineyella sp. TaxID=1911550 RepID=UPI002B1EA6EC|nr:VOC family protein [Raineyella sp.]MEA5153480.1 VOC family protein [Raineyella sp.]